MNASNLRPNRLPTGRPLAIHLSCEGSGATSDIRYLSGPGNLLKDFRIRNLVPGDDVLGGSPHKNGVETGGHTYVAYSPDCRCNDTATRTLPGWNDSLDSMAERFKQSEGVFQRSQRIAR